MMDHPINDEQQLCKHVRIECGLFLLLSSDVGKLLQVLDETCMGCGELNLVNG